MEPLKDLIGPHECDYDTYDGEQAGTMDSEGFEVRLYGYSCRLCSERTFKTDVPNNLGDFS